MSPEQDGLQRDYATVLSRLASRWQLSLTCDSPPPTGQRASAQRCGAQFAFGAGLPSICKPGSACASPVGRRSAPSAQGLRKSHLRAAPLQLLQRRAFDQIVVLSFDTCCNGAHGGRAGGAMARRRAIVSCSRARAAAECQVTQSMCLPSSSSENQELEQEGPEEGEEEEESEHGETLQASAVRLCRRGLTPATTSRRRSRQQQGLDICERGDPRGGPP